uniref:At2g23090-like zinc-binding domain-containing protein n=2 Tax=Octactis speculum TaxID=3111310 RepID=A0A7S2H271_9STRA
MPLGGKALKKREQARDAKAGIIRDAGALRKKATAKKEEKCLLCGTIFKITKKNADARIHSDSKHPTSSFEACFPEAAAYERELAAEVSAAAAAPAQKKVVKKKKKNATDVSLLMEGLTVAPKKKSGKK